MRIKVLLAVCMLCGISGFALSDPTLMTISGHPVSRSEFVYLYNKNNAPGVIQKTSLDDFLRKFIDYKLKVMAAREAYLDTLATVKHIHSADQRPMSVPTNVGDTQMEAEARRIYAKIQRKTAQSGGWIRPAQILIRLSQRATKAQETDAQRRIETIYSALQRGEDFYTLARQYSDDRESAPNGGRMPWIRRGETLKEFEDQAFSMQPGDISRPFISPLGWHILRLDDKQPTLAYDSLRTNLLRFVDQQNLRKQLSTDGRSLTDKVKAQIPAHEQALAEKQKWAERADSDRRNQLCEYEEGLLVCAISNRISNRSVVENDQAIAAYFKKHKKKYRWEQPRFQGIVFYAKDKADAKRIKALLKKRPFGEWEILIRTASNRQSENQRPFAVGYFEVGDNALVDRKVFKKLSAVVPVTEFPITEAYGKKLKRPKTWSDVRLQVVADYRESLENEWLSALRKRYSVEIDKAVLATIKPAVTVTNKTY